MSSTSQYTEELCIENLAIDEIPITGWFLFMLIMLLMLCATITTLMVCKFKGLLDVTIVDRSFVAIKFTSLVVYLIAMCRNLDVLVQSDHILLCGVPMDHVCMDLTDMFASMFVKAFVVINFIFYVLAAVFVELKRMKLDDDFKDIRQLAWGCNKTGYEKLIGYGKMIIFRQFLVVFTAAFSPGFAVLEAIPLSLYCIVDTNVGLLLAHVQGHFALLLFVLVLIPLHLYHKKEWSANLIILAIAMFLLGGIFMFFIQLFASFSNVLLMKSYVLTFGFVPLLWLFSLFLGLLEWVYMIHYGQTNDFKSLLRIPVQPLVEDMRDFSNFPLATTSFDVAFAAVQKRVSINAAEFMAQLTKLVSTPNAQEVQAQFQLTDDELRAIFAYTMEGIYRKLNQALREERQKETYDELWENDKKRLIGSQCSGKSSFLPYLYLLYSAMAKLKSLPGAKLARGYIRFTNDPVNTEPYTIAGKLQPMAQLNSATTNCEVALLRFANGPDAFVQYFQCGMPLSKGRDIQFLSEFPDEAEVLFPCDTEFETIDVLTLEIVPHLHMRTTIRETDRPDLDFFSIFDTPEYQKWYTVFHGNNSGGQEGNILPNDNSNDTNNKDGNPDDRQNIYLDQELLYFYRRNPHLAPGATAPNAVEVGDPGMLSQ